MKHLWIALWLAALCLCLGLAGAAGETDGYAPVAKDGHISLFANTETGEIIVRDERDGYLWRSNPKEPDAKAKGVHKMTLQSQLVIGYATERGTALTALSANDSLRRDGFSMTISDGQAVAVYDFPKAEISVTVRYRLQGGCLIVTVPVEETRAYGLNTLTGVELLPAFGAGGAQEEGFLLLPDGCGALVRFNNGVTAMNEYKAAVYGKDPSVNGQVSLTLANPQARTYEQPVRLPVFGVSKGAHGLLAIITENDSKAVLHARVSNLTSYNYVYSEFQLRSSGTMIMNRKEFEQTIAGVSEREGLTTGNYTVRYCFLNGEAQSGLSGMAAAYRRYLMDEKGLQARVADNAYPLYLDVYGYVNKTAQFLGIPYVRAVPLTTLDDVRAIVEAIGVEQTAVRYNQWLSGGAYGRIAASAAPQKGLGGKADMTALSAWLTARGGALYPDADLCNVYKTGRGFLPLRDAVLTPANSPQMQYQLNYGNNKLDPTIAPWYLLSPLRYERFYGRYLDSFRRLDIGAVSLSVLGDTLTSDNRTRGMGRQAAQRQAAAVLQEAARFASVMTDGGNAYAAALSSHVVKAPAASSDFALCDETVPFWQMVFHGYIHYSLSPVNHAGDPEEMLLKCLEYGASPLYSLVGRNVNQLMDSRMLFLFSADYTAWAADARDRYDTLSSVLGRLAAQPITGYEIRTGDVRCTHYGDTRVYVNYGDDDYQADGLTVPARGYAVREGV